MMVHPLVRYSCRVLRSEIGNASHKTPQPAHRVTHNGDLSNRLHVALTPHWKQMYHLQITLEINKHHTCNVGYSIYESLRRLQAMSGLAQRAELLATYVPPTAFSCNCRRWYRSTSKALPTNANVKSMDWQTSMMTISNKQIHTSARYTNLAQAGSTNRWSQQNRMHCWFEHERRQLHWYLIYKSESWDSGCCCCGWPMALVSIY